MVRASYEEKKIRRSPVQTRLSVYGILPGVIYFIPLHYHYEMYLGEMCSQTIIMMTNLFGHYKKLHVKYVCVDLLTDRHSSLFLIMSFVNHTVMCHGIFHSIVHLKIGYIGFVIDCTGQ